MLPKHLTNKLKKRKAQNALRQLNNAKALIDFSSNDYLGFSNSEAVFYKSHQYLIDHNFKQNGSTGSRLLSGNNNLYTAVETTLSTSHNSEAALILNSGYSANLGLLSSVAQRGDIIVYDALVHASIRDGISMSNAKSYKFKHNDLSHLEDLLKRFKHHAKTIYIITESVFSMDGDSPNIPKLAELSSRYKAYLIIDEAHALGVFDKGLVQQLELSKAVFARIITFGKALGCHGAAILGSQQLKDYLINFSRPFIYTTALPPHALATITCAYKALAKTDTIKKLNKNIEFFSSEIVRLQLQKLFIGSQSAIHSCIIPGNATVKAVAQELQNKGFDVKPILSPTVPMGMERLRFCLHSYNSKQEITEVLSVLATFVKA